MRHFDLLRGALFGSLPWLLSIVSIPLGNWLFDRTPCDRRAMCLAFATALVLGVEGPFWATMTAVAGARSGAGGGVMRGGADGVGGSGGRSCTALVLDSASGCRGMRQAMPAARSGASRALCVAAVGGWGCAPPRDGRWRCARCGPRDTPPALDGGAAQEHGWRFARRDAASFGASRPAHRRSLLVRLPYRPGFVIGLLQSSKARCGQAARAF